MRSRLHALYPALSALPEVQQDRLFAAANLLQLPAGAAIFSENQPCGGFPLILEGSIKVIKQASNGRELLLYRVGPGDSCIISSSCLLGKTAYNARGVTETELTLCVLPVVEFHRLLKGFAGQGLVSLGREQITLLDRAGLRALVTM